MGSRMKLGLAVGALGAGVTTLALVGTGVTANFTASVNDHTTISSGDFHLQAVNPTTSVTDPHPGATLTKGTLSIKTVTGTSQVTVQQGNANPTATYTYQFTAYDSGTLSGQVTTVIYTPGVPHTTLMNHASITVEACGYTGAGRGTACFGALSATSQTKKGTPAFPANTGQTLHFQYPTGSGLNEFFQPNTAALKTPGRSQGWVEYRVIVTFAPTTPNTAENSTFTFSLQVAGHSR